jgi:type II secretory pathway component PulK
MAKKVILQRKRLAAIFASFAVLIIGTASLLESMSLDYYSVLNTLQKILPASLALGGLGWFMGMILDKQKRNRGRGGHNNLFINELMKNTAAETLTPGNENAGK